MTNKELLEKIGKQSPFFYKVFGTRYCMTDKWLMAISQNYFSQCDFVISTEEKTLLDGSYHVEISKEEFLEAYQSAINENTLLLHELRGQTEKSII